MAIVYTPTVPVAGDTVTLTLTRSGTTQRAPGWVLDTVPADSALTAGALLDNAGALSATFTPDVSGEYAISGHRYARVEAPARFAGDKAGEDWGIIDLVETTTVHVAEVLALPIRLISGHDVTLQLKLQNDSVSEATLVSPATELASQAADDSTVSTKLAALVSTTTLTLSDTLATHAEDLRASYEAHRVLTAGSVHASSDTTNALEAEACDSDQAAIVVLNEVYDALTAHRLAGASGGTWHTTDDSANEPMVIKASDFASAHVLFADLGHRVYESHRTQTATPTVHGASDTTNSLAAIKPLHDFIKAYLDFIDSPTATGRRAAGTARGARRYGFEI